VPASGSARTGRPKKRSSAFLFARDAGIALVLVALILVTMYAYTGLWPPLVVVESNSMMHGDDNLSHVGTETRATSSWSVRLRGSRKSRHTWTGTSRGIGPTGTTETS
jgi:hypothetical protein